MTDSDSDHELGAPTAAQWHRFEENIHKLLQQLDPHAAVQHNITVQGELSGTRRQVDVLITGMIAGQQIRIAVECKHYARKLGIGAVDEFAGKLLDLGADRGVLYGLNGVTDPAQRRARGSKPPRIEIGDLLTGPHHVDIDIDRLLSFGDCSNDNCYTGDVWWETWRSSDGDYMRAGECDICGTLTAMCPECFDVVSFVWDEEPCHCGTTVSLIRDRKGDALLSIEITTSEGTRSYDSDHESPDL